MNMHKISQNKKGQGSAMSGDLPMIIMIVVAIAFFLSALIYSLEEFESGKTDLQMRRAVVDAANAFLKESAKISPSDIDISSPFWQDRIDRIRKTYGVELYVELISLGSEDLGCPEYNPCSAGQEPLESSSMILVNSFPVAIKDTDLYVYPGLISVTIWK
jgi:hypothetical protein